MCRAEHRPPGCGCTYHPQAGSGVPDSHDGILAFSRRKWLWFSRQSCPDFPVHSTPDFPRSGDPKANSRGHKMGCRASDESAPTTNKPSFSTHCANHAAFHRAPPPPRSGGDRETGDQGADGWAALLSCPPITLACHTASASRCGGRPPAAPPCAAGERQPARFPSLPGRRQTGRAAALRPILIATYSYSPPHAVPSLSI